MEVESKPGEIDEIDRRLIQLKIEREALRKETDAASRERLAKLEVEIAELGQKSATLTAEWQAEKDEIAGAQKLKERLDQARSELEQAQRNGDFNRAGELAYRVIRELTRQLAANEETEHHRMLNAEVRDRKSKHINS